MDYIKILPTAMIVLAIGASILILAKDPTNWRQWGYWLAAATMNYCVTY